MKCVICGRSFPDKMTMVKTRMKSKEYVTRIPQELCDYCTAPKAAHRRAQKMEIPDGAIDGCIRLAGAVIKGCIQYYKQLYWRALKEVTQVKRLDGEAVNEFLWYDQIVHRPYYAHLTFGKMPELIQYARRKEDESLSGDMAKAAERIKERMTGERCNEDRTANTD